MKFKPGDVIVYRGLVQLILNTYSENQTDYYLCFDVIKNQVMTTGRYGPETDFIFQLIDETQENEKQKVSQS